MVALSPTERIERLRDDPDLLAARPHAVEILERYATFLDKTDASEAELVARFGDREAARALTKQANELGDAMYSLLQAIGEENALKRLLVV